MGEEEGKIKSRIQGAFEVERCTTEDTYHSHGIGVDSDDWVVRWRYLRQTGRGEVRLNQALLCLCLLVKLADADLAMYRTWVYVDYIHTSEEMKKKVTEMTKCHEKRK